MAVGNPSTAVNLRLPRLLVSVLDQTLLAWRSYGFEGDRRDVIEALISYSFFLHRGANEIPLIPPALLSDMEFKKPFDPEREDEEFFPMNYSEKSTDYNAARWQIP